ncbi:MAG: hypothetical protein WA823_14430 [Candidatus Acidiferrales bacterium]
MNFARLAIILTIVSVTAGAVRGDCVDHHVVGMFPKAIAEFACANLDSAKTLPWFNDFKGQVLPQQLYGFDQFLVSAGVNPNSDVNQIAWGIGSPAASATATDRDAARSQNMAPDADQFVSVLIGEFDPGSIATALNLRNLPVVTYREHVLYPVATRGSEPPLYFLPIDTDTVAIGSLSMLRSMLDVENGAAESLLSNQPFLDLIDRANGDTTFWGAFNETGTRAAIRQLATGSAQYTGSDKLFQDIQSLILTADASSSDIEVHFQITTDSSKDSVMLSQILQAALMIRKYLAQSETPPNPALAAALDHVSVTPQAAAVDVSIDIPNDQLRDLILQRTFAGT